MYFASSETFCLIYKIEKLFVKYKNLTIRQISNLLKEQYSINEIELAVNYLLVDRGIIVRDDYWNKESVYRYVDYEYYHDSAVTRQYYSFNVDDNKNKKFLLISDTHIGNTELENYNMIQNIYNFSLQQGVTKCFHMGDIFSRLIDNFPREDDVSKLFNLFGEYYPNIDEIKTYGLIGNHDENINGFFDKIPIPYIYDLRQLTRYSRNFYVIPRNKWEATFSNVKIHFSHRLYLNWVVNSKIINSLDEISKDNIFCENKYNVLISGHLHKGFIYNYVYDNKDQLLLGVPSATNINKNGVVGYIVSLNYDNQENISHMDITLLLCDSNNKISEGETITWNFKEKNKSLKKLF